MTEHFIELRNAQALPLAAIPVTEFSILRPEIAELVRSGLRVEAFFELPGNDGRLLVLLADDQKGTLPCAVATLGAERSFASLAPELPAFALFERELFESSGITPLGHPELKPVRYPDGGSFGPAVTDFRQMRGDAVHEVAVGPVHAGVIEPGHFRFQCVGETVCNLEIALGYQHRGAEAMLTGTPSARTRAIIETIAGDSSVAAATNYALALESICGVNAMPRAESLRSIALELERVANHVGDLGALAGDVAFLPSASFCGRIRGEYLNLTASLCGNRFGRGLIRPGGVGFDLSPEACRTLLRKLDALQKPLEQAMTLMLESPSVRDRFENTGAVSAETAVSLGLVGVAARASGLECDCRASHPVGSGRRHITITPRGINGDVFDRAKVRELEVLESLRIIRSRLCNLPGGKVELPLPAPRPDMIVAVLTEAWRGELLHVFLTGERGEITRCKVVDPSFHNWPGLARALRGEAISDFPICNKSFNLSYCGHDL